MKFFKKLFTHTLIYKIYDLFYWLKTYITDYGYVAESLHSEGFHLILKRYLNADFRSDWLGREYGVVNPSLDTEGKFNFSNQIFEIDGKETNSNEFVKVWLYKQMSLVSDVYQLEHTGFFDLICADIKHVGPKEHDNYLIIFDIVSRKEMALAFKSFIKRLLLLIILIGIGFGIYFLI